MFCLSIAYINGIILYMTDELRIEEYTGEDGQTAIIYRKPNGRFAPGTQSPAPITHENARAYHQQRIEKYREAAIERMHEEFIANGQIPQEAGPQDAWGTLVSRVAEQIMDSDRPRGDDMLAVGRAIGAIETAGQRSANEDTSNTSWGDFIANSDITITHKADVPIEAHSADVIDLSTLTDEQREAIARIIAAPSKT